MNTLSSVVNGPAMASGSPEAAVALESSSPRAHDRSDMSVLNKSNNNVAIKLS